MTESGSPTSTLESLGLAPPGSAPALLLRHAHRPPIPAGDYGDGIGATPEGLQRARGLGARLAPLHARRIGASSVDRCVRTAEAIADGAGWSLAVESLWQLGAPGPFVVDAPRAGAIFLKHGTRAVVDRMLSGSGVPGMRATRDGVRRLVCEIVARSHREEGIGVFVTHDSILAIVIGWLWNRRWEDGDGWPRFLEGLALWPEDDVLVAAWRGDVRRVTWPL